MQENKKQKTNAKRLFLVGEEPNGERFVITDQTAADTTVEIVQQPLSQYGLSADKQDITSAGWQFNSTTHNEADSSYS